MQGPGRDTLQVDYSFTLVGSLSVASGKSAVSYTASECLTVDQSHRNMGGYKISAGDDNLCIMAVCYTVQCESSLDRSVGGPGSNHFE